MTDLMPPGRFAMERRLTMRLVWAPSATAVLFLTAAFLPITLRGRWGSELPAVLSTAVLLVLAALAARHAGRVYRLAVADPPQHALALLRLRMRPLRLGEDPDAWSRIRRVHVHTTRQPDAREDRTSRAVDRLFDLYYERLGLTPAVHVIYDADLGDC